MSGGDFYGNTGFGGGGYNANSSPQGSPGQQRTASEKSEQNLVPVTIKQLLDAEHVNEGFAIDGKMFRQFRVVASIRDVTESSTAMTIDLEDGTGHIVCKYWHDNTETDAGAISTADWKVGCYIQVVGQMRDHQGTRSCVAYNIKPVTDHNQITYHFLNAMHVHIQQTKSATAAGAQFGTTGNLVHVATNGDSLLTVQEPQGDGDDMSPAQQAILQLFQNHSGLDDAGLDIKIIIQNLVGKYSAEDIKIAVARLSEEGHIYSTIDDNHYMVT